MTKRGWVNPVSVSSIAGLGRCLSQGEETQRGRGPSVNKPVPLTMPPTTRDGELGNAVKAGGADWSDTCRVAVCNAGYDTEVHAGVCEETIVGYYAEGDNRTTRTVCSANVNNVNMAIPQVNARWVGTGLTRASACRWECNKGYKIKLNAGVGTGATCVLEVPNVTRFAVKNLKDIGGGGKRGTKGRKLQVRVQATETTHYYLTHVPPAQSGVGFTPAMALAVEGALKGGEPGPKICLQAMFCPMALGMEIITFTYGWRMCRAQ